MIVFSEFRLDARTRRLWRAGASVPLQPKAAELLVLLADAAGEPVAKDALREALWPEGFVEGGSLYQTVYVLRKTLEAAAPDAGPAIETVGRFGYRLIPPVRREEPRTFVQSFRRYAAVAAIVLLAVLSSTLAGSQGPRGTGYSDLGPDLEGSRQIGMALIDQRTEAATRKSFPYFRRVVRERPDSPVGYADLASAYIILGAFQADKALEETYRQIDYLAHEALARDPKNCEALITLGFMLFNRDGDFDQSTRLIRTALQIQSQRAPAWETLGIIELAAGHISEGRAAIEQAVSLSPSTAAYQRWLGIAQYYTGDYSAAIGTLRRSLDLGQNPATAYYLFLAYEVQGDLAGETIALRQVERSGPPRAKLDALRAFVKYHQAQGARQRRKAVERVRSLAASDADARFLLALIYGELRRDREALALLKRQTDRDVAFVYFRLIPLDPHFRRLYARAG